MRGLRVRWCECTLSLVATLQAGCQIPEPTEFDAVPVYEAVLAQLESQHTSSVVTLLDATPWARPSKGHFETVDASNSLLRAYAWANSSPIPFTRAEAEAIGLELINSDSIFAPAPTGPIDLHEVWLSLEATHGSPVVILGFSRPGFSKSGTEAILHYEYSCGSLCGAALVARLQKFGSDWRVVADFTYQVS